MLSPQHLQQIDKTFAAIKVWYDGFEITDFDHLSDMMANAALLKKYHSIHSYSKILVNKASRTTVMATEISHYHKNGEAPPTGYLHWLVIRELEKDFGHILINPATLTSRLSEFFKIEEYDFQTNPEFSLRYHFSSNTPALAFEFATPERLKAIEKVDDLVIEVSGAKVFASCTHELKPADCVSLIGAVLHL